MGIAAVWGRALQAELFPSGERCIFDMLQCNVGRVAARGTSLQCQDFPIERGAPLGRCNATFCSTAMSALGGKRTPGESRFTGQSALRDNETRPMCQRRL